jgi:hypothetical protein
MKHMKINREHMAQVQYSTVQQAHSSSYKQEAHEDQQGAHSPSTVQYSRLTAAPIRIKHMKINREHLARVQYSTVQYSKLTAAPIRIKHMRINKEHLAQVQYSTVQQAHSSSYKNEAHEDQQGAHSPSTLQYITAGSLLLL